MSAALFITLNILDAYLTKMALVVGAIEFNPIMTSIGSSILVKGAMAGTLVFILYYFKKEKALWPLNLLLFGVILWNIATYGIVTFTLPVML